MDKDKLLEQKINWLATGIMYIIKSECPFSPKLLEEYFELFEKPMLTGEE